MAKGQKPNGTTARPEGHLGFETTLWATADKLRGNLDAAEYKHVVLGLIFLKYISDAFEERHAELQKEKGADPKDRELTEQDIQKIGDLYHQWKLDIGQLLKEGDKRGIVFDLAPPYAD